MGYHVNQHPQFYLCANFKLILSVSPCTLSLSVVKRWLAIQSVRVRILFKSDFFESSFRDLHQKTSPSFRSFPHRKCLIL
ncbi:hypothetical protein L596_030178 [Steinernema carpocapsae]|uniref:Uncharacterized protein n=1 Tax=Steinernema carpocapsae TaxID=34508 RepID=A0A4U5LRZ1_STECR|nr:hypothetical protein L596_030178 [Steinernema carpocapsae]